MEEQINFEYNGQYFTRDYCLDRKFHLTGKEIFSSRAYRVYNHDPTKLVLPIAYIIQVWPNESKALKIAAKTMFEKDKVIDDFFGKWHRQQNSQ